MRPNRRHLLQAAPLGLLASLTPWVADAAPSNRQPLAGLLLPLTGQTAELGLSMERAAGLAQPSNGRIMVLDSRPAAEAAALQALGRGAPIILGPLFAPEVRPVVAAVGGRAPVLSFSNDGSLLDSGAFLFGVTPAQSVSAIMLYARERGVRRVAVIAAENAWDQQSAAAARLAAMKLDMTLAEIDSARAEAAGDTLPALLEQASGGALPDATLIPGGGPGSRSLARRMGGLGIQLLGTSQWADMAAPDRRALEGAWFASPDPSGFAEFARAYQASYGGPPTAVAGLAYDAVKIAETLSRERDTRAGLLAPGGFPGVMGAVRFHPDGSCARELGVLVNTGGGVRTVERTAGA